jgi:hypothetical protein
MDEKEIIELQEYLEREFYEIHRFSLMLKKAVKSSTIHPLKIRKKAQLIYNKMRGALGVRRIFLGETRCFKRIKEDYEKLVAHLKNIETEDSKRLNALMQQAEVFNNFLVKAVSRGGEIQEKLKAVIESPTDQEVISPLLKLFETTQNQVSGFEEVVKQIEKNERERFLAFDWLTEKPVKVKKYFDWLSDSKKHHVLKILPKRKDVTVPRHFKGKVVRLSDYPFYLMTSKMEYTHIAGYHTTCEAIAQIILKEGFRQPYNGTVDFHHITTLFNHHYITRQDYYGSNACAKAVNAVVIELFASHNRNKIENSKTALEREIKEILKRINPGDYSVYSGLAGAVPIDFVHRPFFRAQTIEVIIPRKMLTGDFSTAKVDSHGDTKGYELHVIKKVPAKFITHLGKPFNVFGYNTILVPPTQQLLKHYSGKTEIDMDMRMEIIGMKKDIDRNTEYFLTRSRRKKDVKLTRKLLNSI